MTDNLMKAAAQTGVLDPHSILAGAHAQLVADRSMSMEQKVEAGFTLLNAGMALLGRPVSFGICKRLDPELIPVAGGIQ